MLAVVVVEVMMLLLSIMEVLVVQVAVELEVLVHK
tara:strand:+ start:292 stop:396 length:105 start_codon:yes stop_codon:yes gene_type:complete